VEVLQMDLTLRTDSEPSMIGTTMMMMMKRKTRKQEQKTFEVGSEVETEEEIPVVVGKSVAFVAVEKKKSEGMK